LLRSLHPYVLLTDRSIAVLGSSVHVSSYSDRLPEPKREGAGLDGAAPRGPRHRGKPAVEEAIKGELVV
jgi:hypothetical protein